MSTTRITIVKIVGRLGERINYLFQHWLELGKCSEIPEGPFLNLTIQDKSTIQEMLSLSCLLGNHCDFASVIWFQQFVDPWTIAPCLHAIDDFMVLSDGGKVIRSHSLDAMMLTASDRSIARCLKDIILKSRNERNYSAEWRYFHNQLRKCAISWQPFLESNNISTIILVFFHAIGPSRLDSDVIRMAETVPEWFETASEEE